MPPDLLKGDAMSARMRTKDFIADTFEEMLKTQSFNSITVQGIIQTCGISRTTFYRHFQDKFELMNWIYKARIEDILKHNPDFFTWKKVIYETLQFIQEKNSYFKNTFSYKNQNALGDFLFECTRDYWVHHLQREANVNELPGEIVASIKFYSAGVIYTLGAWITGGMKEPYEMIAQRMCDNIPKPIGQYLK